MPYTPHVLLSYRRRISTARPRAAVLVTVLVALVAMVASGCSSSSDNAGAGQLTVDEATIDWPANPSVAAVRFTITNDTSTDDVLTAASSPRAAKATIHRSMTDSAGRSTMKPLERVDVPAGESVLFEAGDLHVMLEDPSPELEVGETVAVTLVFEKAGKRTVRAKVVEPGSGDTMEGHGE